MSYNLLKKMHQFELLIADQNSHMNDSLYN